MSDDISDYVIVAGDDVSSDTSEHSSTMGISSQSDEPIDALITDDTPYGVTDDTPLLPHDYNHDNIKFVEVETDLIQETADNKEMPSCQFITVTVSVVLILLCCITKLSIILQ